MAPVDPHQDDPLPPGWLRQFSNSQQRNFYFHKETKHTQWHFPTASEAKDPEKAKERAQANKEREQRKRGDSSTSLPSEKRRKTSEEKPAITKNPSSVDDVLTELDATSVAIIVPFRDLHAAQHRAAHLEKFVPHMTKFLSELKKNGQISHFHIYIIEQSDDQRKFNRGKLLNIGFDLAHKHHKLNKAPGVVPHDVFIFHDVDLLPQPDLQTAYAQFPSRPLHIARVWDRYSNNPKYFGGVVSFSVTDYKRINGYPNNYWGWGMYDCVVVVVVRILADFISIFVFLRIAHQEARTTRCNVVWND